MDGEPLALRAREEGTLPRRGEVWFVSRAALAAHQFEHLTLAPSPRPFRIDVDDSESRRHGLIA
jgi:hypothetical protein